MLFHSSNIFQFMHTYLMKRLKMLPVGNLVSLDYPCEKEKGRTYRLKCVIHCVTDSCVTTEFMTTYVTDIDVHNN